MVIQLTQDKVTVVSSEWFEELSKYKWYAKKAAHNYYAARSKYINGKVITIYMHRVITNCPKGLEPHHKNRNSLDNRVENLEVGTKSSNLSKRVFTKKQ